MPNKLTTKLQIRLDKSMICRTQRQRATLRGLGLRKIRQTVEREDTPQVRGMIEKLKFMLTVKEVS